MRWTERTPVLLLSIQQPAWCWRLQNQSLSTLFSLFLTSLSAADITQVMFGIGKCFLQPWANTKCVQSTVCSNRNGDRLQVNPFLKEGFHQKGLRVLTDRPEFEMYMLIHKNQKSGLVTTLLCWSMLCWRGSISWRIRSAPGNPCKWALQCVGLNATAILLISRLRCLECGHKRRYV